MTSEKPAELNESTPEKLPYRRWFLYALLFGSAGSLLILWTVGFGIWDLTTGRPRVFPPRLETTAHGHVVTASVTWFGGIIALYTYFLTRDQKEKHLDKQLKENQKIESDRRQQLQDFETARRTQEQRFELARRTQERVLEAKRERRERDLAELQRLEAEFAGLARDFVSPDPLARINAAIGFGEIARKPDPRRLEPDSDFEENEPLGTDAKVVAKSRFLPLPQTPNPAAVVGENRSLLEELIPWRSEWRSAKSEENFPYFLRVVHRLAASLHQWHDDAARAQAQRVLKELAQWAKDPGTDEPLLHGVVNALADANRTAWRRLREQTVYCLNAGSNEGTLAGLLGYSYEERDESVSSKRGDEELLLLQRLFSDALEDPLSSVLDRLPTALRGELGVLEADYSTAARSLYATRDSLAAGIQFLSAPPDFPTLPTLTQEDLGENASNANGIVADWQRQRKRWMLVREVIRRRRSLDLSECFLFDASLEQAHLEGATCKRAEFTGANLSRASFAWAAMDEAVFIGAKCRETDFGKARMMSLNAEHISAARANFFGASCINANFNGGKFTKAQFSCAECEFIEAHDAEFNFADMRAADFTGAILNEAAVAGARMGQDGGPKTKFEEHEWVVADFKSNGHVHDPEADESGAWDRVLWRFLDLSHPAEGRVPPWEPSADDLPNG